MVDTATIEQLLRAGLEVAALEIHDDSALHAGHAGARDGGKHYRLTIVSGQFEAMPRVGRHRAVYAILSGLMQREIHALTINALTPSEAAAQTSSST